jgi:hypothetical protein
MLYSCENHRYGYLIGTLETTKRYYRVDRREIAFLRFIFEAYDGIAVLQTIDAPKGLVLLHVAPGCEKDVEYLVQNLKKEIMIESTSV